MLENAARAVAEIPDEALAQSAVPLESLNE